MITLKLVNLEKQYLINKMALQNVSASFTAGLHVFIGPNGAGKTTLFRILAGVLNPGLGDVWWCNQKLGSNKGSYKQRLGYLPQHFDFYPDMCGKEILYYMAKLKGIPPELQTARIYEIAELTGLHPVFNKKIMEWSTGLKRRLGIAQAILNDPDILILDEPMLGLDPQEKLFFWDYFSQLARERIVLISSNTLTDFITLGDRLLVLVEGKVEFDGQFQEFLETVTGKVWSVSLSLEAAQSLQPAYAISAFHGLPGACQIRIVSDHCPDIAGVRPEQPKLADAYHYLVGYRHFKLKE
ncbi:ABC transporter ATP-binding protein [Sporomusaceae bacterium FL31]|nr:ABC transporter ATP-binding protein [Sporomusaceae bacterium FL31]GCE35247.1 ABC transporter ATP-binding protein [Sporomusaceae bacterium]